MLARQVSDLALVRRGRIARRVCGAVVRVQVNAGGSAVEAGDGELVDVVACGRNWSTIVSTKVAKFKDGITEWATLFWQARDGDLNIGARAVGVRVDHHGAADVSVIPVREHRGVLGADRVACDDWCVGCKRKREGDEAQGESEGTHGQRSV